MRAWAAISAAAVLVALPMSAQQAAGEPAVPGTTAPVADSGADVLSADSLGVMLWLAVAVVAVVTAFLVLRRTRAQLDPVAAGSATSVIPLSFSRSEQSGSVATSNGR